MSSTLLKPDFSATPHLLPGERPHRRSGISSVLAVSLARLGRSLPKLAHRRVPALQLEFPDRFVRFRSLREFEFSLVSRTEFPTTRMRELMQMTPLALERAAAEIREAERRFSRILSTTVREPELIGELFRELELQLFSHDHNWREIMEGLMRLSPAYNPYKRVALVKYMQYLRARQTILRSVFLDKTRDDRNAKVHASVPAHALAETATFDAPADAVAADRRFVSLPKGESVRVRPDEDAREILLMLAGNPMRLFTGREFYIVDAGDNTFPLHPGKNLVGRHSGCDVVVDPACRAVSRHHLIVEPALDGSVILTDLSSHGTEIPAGLMPGPAP